MTYPQQLANPQTKYGWNQYVDADDPSRPHRITHDELRRMTKRDRSRYNAQRHHYHENFPPLSTPWFRRAFKDGIRLVRSNLDQRRPGARRGLALDGHGGLGKSVFMDSFARWWQRELRKLYPTQLTAEGHEYIPVARLMIEGKPSIRGVNALFAKFFDFPLRGDPTWREGTEQAVNVLHLCATNLIMLDDIHFLKLHRINDQDVRDYIKNLQNVVPATIIVAGIDLRNGFLSEGLAPENGAVSQTAARFIRVPFEPFSLHPQPRLNEWIGLLKQLEQELILADAKPGDLDTRLRVYLYERSRGEIGQLIPLLREAARIAIADRSERITEALLDDISLSYRADPTGKYGGVAGRA